MARLEVGGFRFAPPKRGNNEKNDTPNNSLDMPYGMQSHQENTADGNIRELKQDITESETKL